MIIGKRFTFEAAHHLPNHGGKCKNLHGHRYELFVEIEGPCINKSFDNREEEGMVMDYVNFSNIIKEEILDLLDHCDLNVRLPNPTCENLLGLFIKILQVKFSTGPIRLKSIVLKETENTWAKWER
jgi:6-pyruvoyltetrahydropterin/6-carboxytetrahydropterin synthase